VSSIASQLELAVLLDHFPLDPLAERLINSLSFIRRLFTKIRHLQAASTAEDSGTLSCETLVSREKFDAMRHEWTAMCRHWRQRVRNLKQVRIDGEDFLRRGRRDAESHHQARATKLTDQVAQLQAQLRDYEAARQAVQRRTDERVLDVNALVDFLMVNKLKINVMFNWMCLAALLHPFAEGTSIPEGWLTHIDVVALDDRHCECPEYANLSPRPGNGDSSSGPSSSRRPRVLDLSPPACNKRASTFGSRTGNRKRRHLQHSRHQRDCQLRPRGYSPRDMLVYSPRNVPNARNLAESGLALPDGMIWTNVREDVQYLLLCGMDFKCAMKWVSESQATAHPPWHPLGRCFIKDQKRKKSSQETEALQVKFPESSDDEAQDPSYELSQAELGKAARAEAAVDNDESSEESDEAETESKPAAAHLSATDPRESKTQKTGDKSSGSKSHVKDYGDFMRVNAKPWQAILYWLTISFLGRDPTDADASRDLYGERRRDVKRLRAQYEALLKRSFAIPAFPKTLLYEPGLWTLPVCACHWILNDPERSPLIRSRVAYYAAHLDDLNAEDPVRTQWPAAHSESDILAYIQAPTSHAV
ncbi:hypothetical protein PHMEG_00011065, partial [Phytophthora megakarya]